MASNFQIQQPYVLATLPRPLDPKTGRYVVGEVYGTSEGSKKRKRSEVAIGVDGEAVNIYDVSLHIFSPRGQILKCLRLDLVRQPRYLVPHPASVRLYLPAVLDAPENTWQQRCHPLHLHRDPGPLQQSVSVPRPNRGVRENRLVYEVVLSAHLGACCSPSYPAGRQWQRAFGRSAQR